MKEVVRAVYERESTLWKHANAVYRAQDWVEMICLFRDKSEDRKQAEEFGVKFIDKKTGEDITSEKLKDCFVVLLRNKNGSNGREFRFDNADDANKCVKGVLNHPVFKGWKRVR